MQIDEKFGDLADWSHWHGKVCSIYGAESVFSQDQMTLYKLKKGDKIVHLQVRPLKNFGHVCDSVKCCSAVGSYDIVEVPTS